MSANLLHVKAELLFPFVCADSLPCLTCKKAATIICLQNICEGLCDLFKKTTCEDPATPCGH